MNKLEFISWYGGHLELVAILFMIPAGISWYFYFRPLGREELTWIIVGLMAGIYYWTKRRFRKYCQNLITKKSVSFKETPKISRATSEYLLDSFDTEILSKLDELREDKDDYLKVLPALSDIMGENEIIDRLARLRSLGMVRAQPSRVTLTPAGMEVVFTPFVATKAIVPRRFSGILAKARIELDEGNFNGVIDTVNILFEEILKERLHERFGEELDSKWNDLLKKGQAKVPFDRASLGVLLSACRVTGIIAKGSIFEDLLGTFLKIRIPGKHATGIKSEPEKDARSSLELAQVFVRYWFVL